MTPKRGPGRIRTHPKPKLLLDEGLPPRSIFKHLNQYCDVKHIKHDYHRQGINDKLIYDIAKAQARIVVTFNVRHFKPLLNKEGLSMIGVSPRLASHQIDAKLTSLVKNLHPSNYRGKFFSITGETGRK